MIHKQLIRYLIGGGFVFLVSIGLLSLFVDVLGIWYLWATTAMFILCTGLSFTVQKYWTFRDHSTQGLKGQMGTYVLLQGFNLAANDALMYIAVDLMNVQHVIGQVGTTTIVAAWSFFAYRYLFRQKSTVMLGSTNESHDHTADL